MSFRLKELPSEVIFIASERVHINEQSEKQSIVNIMNYMEKLVKYPSKQKKRKAQ